VPWIESTDPLVEQAWQQSATLPAALLAALDEAAEEGCAAYAPPLVEGAAAPARYRLAVIQQARETWNAGKRDGDLITTDAYAARARELTASVRQLLRPKRGRPGVG